MFCHKCGTKVADDSSFCHGCGAKVMQKGAVIQVSADPIIIPATTVETPTASVEPENTRPAELITQQTSSTSVEIQETYDCLKESTQRCPKIKKIAISKGANGTSGSSLIIHGSFYRYIYTPSTSPEKTSMSWSLTWILYLVYVPILLCDALFLQFFFQKEYYLALTICCLVGCMIWFPFIFFSYKEKKEITIHVNETFNCEMKLPSKARLVVFIVLNLIEIGLCIAAFVSGFGGSTDASSISIDNSASTTFENISLSQTYENKDEGISFMYPTSWQHLNENDFELRKEMIGSSNLILELYTLDNLENEENYYATHMQVIKEPTNLAFYGTKDDFQSSLSLTMNEVNVTELLDIDLNGVPVRKLSYLFNDNGQTCAVIEYYYAIGDDMYGIRFYTLQKNFDKYESIFHAIINSYTVTTANSSDENGTKSSDELPLVVSSDATKVFDEWAANHPLIGNYHLDLISDDEINSAGNEIFLFTLETSSAGIFNMSIRKSDGYMEYINKFELMSMDDWYKNWFADDLDNSVENIAGNLSYKDVLLTNLLGSNSKELYSIFGAPTGGTAVNGELLYGATEYCTYDGIGFMFDEEGNVFNIRVHPAATELNGTTLDRNRAGIINILGTPGYEGPIPEDESGEGLGGYYIMEYTLYENGTIITVELPDADSKASNVTISWYNDGPDDEEYHDSNNYINDSFEWVETAAGSTDNSLGTTHVKGVIKNTSTKTYSYVQITFNLYDSSGNQIDTALATINNLKAGGTWRFDAVSFNKNVARFEFSSIDAF